MARLTYEEVMQLRREQRNEKSSSRMTARNREAVAAARLAARIAAKKKAKPRRITKAVDLLTERSLNQEERKRDPKRQCFVRSKTPEKTRLHRLIAYDLETTKIQAGTPRVLYLTAYNGREGEEFWFSGAIKGQRHLAEIIETRFLTKENVGTRFIAWNGNGYDAYFVAAALIFNTEFTVKPYLTKSNALRGFRVIRNGTEDSWEFLDGMAMLYQMKLSEFLKSFAPDHLKLDAPDWEKEEFDPTNKAHVDYAERDSIGLWHGMEKARGLIVENFHIDLAPTIGNTAIQIFGHHIPHGVKIREPKKRVKDLIHDYVMRGGYCELLEQYTGPLWKYDLNQAYAAAMRESPMPQGACLHLGRYSAVPDCAIWRIKATHSTNIIPFYYKPCDSDRDEAVFATREIRDTWVTSTEYRQLEAEG
jgi:hypothetical protein